MTSVPTSASYGAPVDRKAPAKGPYGGRGRGGRYRGAVVQVLDCSNVESALASLAASAGVSTDRLRGALDAVADEEILETEDPNRAMEGLVERHLGVPFGSLTAVRYFHGTRTIDPDRIRREGLLPLGAVIDRIWDTLRALAGDRLDTQQWQMLRSMMEEGRPGHFADLYALKTRNAHLHGPYGLLIRDELLRPRDIGNTDYVKAPEIIDDIAITASEQFGVDLSGTYRAASRSCIVAFDVPSADPPAEISAACWYVRTHPDLTRNGTWAFDGQGHAVTPEAIVSVDVLADE